MTKDIEPITFCTKYGLPTSKHSCSVCYANRKTDPFFAQLMRNVGLFFGSLTCKFRKHTETHEEKLCCGTIVKDVPVFHCDKFNETPAPCKKCLETE
jgi:hypothetical protein